MLIQATPHNEASSLAIQVYNTVLERVRADRLIGVAVELIGSDLFIQGHRIDLDAFSSVLVCGAGKASASMAEALVQLLGPRVTGGLVITKHARTVPPLEVLEAGHPLPNEASLLAGQKMFGLAKGCQSDQLVIFVLSGGASALMELPVDGLGLEDLQEANRTLLRSGADIKAINLVRSRISRLKAGGLARAFAPATVVCLVLSDVIGNDLRAIGSAPLMGETNGENPSPALVAQLPTHIRRELGYPALSLPSPQVDHFVIGSVSLAIHEAVDAAKKLGLNALPYGDPLRGHARVMARRIVREAAHQIAEGQEPFCMIFGGETTVKVRGDGAGGRCQEMATAASLQLSKLSNIAFLAAGTDGNDGATEAAGGLSDEGTCARALKKGRSVADALRRNDSYHFLEASDGLVVTGPTESNVNDLVLVVKT